MQEHWLKTVLIFAGFLVGVLACAGVIGIYAYANASVQPNSGLRRDRIVATCANLVLPQRVLLAPVTEDNMGEALKGMNLRGDEESKLRDKMAREKSRLLWVTIWDWDTTSALGDTISITSDDYRRLIRLTSRRNRIAIPEPRSGYIELRGEQSEDGIIAISLLSGTYPLALPRMTPGQAMKVEIDTLP
jgi:hypothetical protein